MPPRQPPTKSKQPSRPHFIKEWAEKFGLSPTELADAAGVDKSLVSRWYNKDSSPTMASQEKLAALFHCEREALFRDPDENWMVNFLRGRNADERARIRATVEAAFPKRGDTE